MLDQAEVGDLDPIADEEEVARLDVQVLQAVLLVHVIESDGRVADVAEEGVAGDADQAGREALLEGVVEILIGQLHDDNELAFDDLDAVHGQDEGVADFLDAVEGLQLLLGARPIGVQRVEVAVDELDGLEQAAGRLAFPGFAKAAAAEGLDEAIPGNRLRIGLAYETHVLSLIVPLRPCSSQFARPRSLRRSLRSAGRSAPFGPGAVSGGWGSPWASLRSSPASLPLPPALAPSLRLCARSSEKAARSNRAGKSPACRNRLIRITLETRCHARVGRSRAIVQSLGNPLSRIIITSR